MVKEHLPGFLISEGKGDLLPMFPLSLGPFWDRGSALEAAFSIPGNQRVFQGNVASAM